MKEHSMASRNHQTRTPTGRFLQRLYLGLLLLVSLPILQTQFAPLGRLSQSFSADPYFSHPGFRGPIRLLSRPLGGVTQFGDGHCRHLPDELGIRAYGGQDLPIDDPVADFQRGRCLELRRSSTNTLDIAVCILFSV